MPLTAPGLPEVGLLPPPGPASGPVGVPARPSPGRWQAWAAAVRPRSLPLALGPVAVGAACGLARTGHIDAVAALLVVAAALLMQVVTNLQNDVGYTVRGAERTGTRTGLPRATAEGWLAVRQVQRAVVWTSLLATALGLALVAWRGWPVLAIGVASLTAALAYMGGPRPIAYTPFGELTVFVFFGMVAVCGTDWVLSGSVGPATPLAAAAIGCLTAAALAVNNHRDAAHDRLVGRRTFAVCFGPTASRRLFAALLALPFALVAWLAWRQAAPALLLPLALWPKALQLHRAFVRCPGGLAFSPVLFGVFRLEGWFALLLSAGLLLT